MTYSTTLRYGRFAPALKATGAEDARDRDHKTREKRGETVYSYPKVEHNSFKKAAYSIHDPHTTKVKPSFDSNLYSQVADLTVMTQNDEALAKFKSALTGSSRD